MTHGSLQERVQNYCQENRVRRKQEWESHRKALDRMKEYKEQQRQQQRVKKNGTWCMPKSCKNTNGLELL